MENLDPNEVARFDAAAARWWDPDGEARPLHDINTARLAYIVERAPPAGRRAIDVGCGGGLLTEALARAGADATGIDAAPAVLEVARQHARGTGLTVNYAQATAEQHARDHAGSYDLVACMELIEHVPDPAGLVAACAALARPGADIVFSTINRSARAYLGAVLGAEYLLGLLPRGTHDYARFVRPHELARWLRTAGCEVLDVRGIRYNPLTRRSGLGRNAGINYLMHARRA
ncbi:MAG: bifunctional 2-polyprenyl-6-hydroxyphenol methylase/3-demethylubiquinol 3-O-methyltransferase UbiG [Gammaproteobacteria bacterium]